MSSWSTILRLSPPVVGQPDDYRRAVEQSAELCEASRELNGAFSRIRRCGIDDLRGEAADALRELVAGVDESLSDLPCVLDDVNDIFADHERQLRRLRRAADEALARARTRWDRLLQAQSSLAQERGNLSSLRHQRDCTPSTPENEDRIAQLSSLISSQVRQVQRCEDRKEEAEAAVCHRMPAGQHPASCSGAADYSGVSAGATSCYQHMSLRNEEEALIRRTVERLNGLNLRGLKDPNWLEQARDFVGNVLSGIGGWFADLFEDIGKMALAAVSGDWGAALHYLRDVLDKVVTVVAVAALVVGFFCTGGALGIVALGLAGAYIGLSAGLAASQEPHPETGQPVTWTEVGLDTALTLAGGPLARGGANLTKRVARDLLRQSRHTRQFANKLPVSNLKVFRAPWTGAGHPYKRAFKPWQGTNRSGNLRGIHTRRRHLKLELGAKVGEDFVLPPVSDAMHDQIFSQEKHIRNYRAHGPSVMSDRAVPLVCSK